MRGTINICETRCIRSIAAAGFVVGVLFGGSALTSAQGPERSTDSVESVGTERDATAEAGGRERLLPAMLAAAAEEEFERCGSRIKPEDVPILEAKRAAGVYELPAGARAAGTNVLPVTVHVVRRDDGTGGLSQARVDQTISDANEIWDGSGIQFCQYGPTRFIDSDFFYHLSPSEGNTLRQFDRVENTINVYFVESYGLFAGQSSFTSSQFQGVIMVNAFSGTAASPSTFAHELGHYFDLYHTHETTFGQECVNGSNCVTAGDQICDTPADYDADPAEPGQQPSSLSFFVDQATCTYMGEFTDPCDDLPYNPDPANVMSYSVKTCRDTLTTQQQDRALAVLLNERSELLDLTCGLDAPCGPGAGECLASNGTPGCDDSNCCALVCASDPFCCDSNWDGVCADGAISMCALAGNECTDAIEIDDGTALSVDLSNNAGSTGGDSSCGVNDELDEWYVYTSPCTGTAVAEICTEFASVQPTIAVFGSCGGEELACSAAPAPDCFLGNGAHAQWNVVAGEKYYVRVSGENATQKQNFSGSLLVSCEGCGAPDAGSCLEDNGSPHCNNPVCCQSICDADPFCCNTSWDNLCADTAAVECDSCGGDATGNCFASNGTPYCDQGACCNAVCGIDPFCCDTNWDGLCAERAVEQCSLFLSGIDVPHIPLGSATLAETNDGGVLLEGFNSDPEPDGMLINLSASPFQNSVFLPAVQMPQPTDGFLEIGVVDLAGAITPSDLPAVQLRAETVSGQGTTISSEFEVSDLHRVQVFDNGTEVFDGPAPCLIVGFAGDAGLPNSLGAEARNNELIAYFGWDESITIELEDAGGGPHVTGDTIVISTLFGSLPDDDMSPNANGQGQPAEVLLGGVRVTAGGDVESMTVLEEHFDLPGPACPADLNFDAAVNVDDLLLVLNNWGACPDGAAGCTGDPVIDGVVNVDDLLEVLNNWGACP